MILMLMNSRLGQFEYGKFVMPFIVMLLDAGVRVMGT